VDPLIRGTGGLTVRLELLDINRRGDESFDTLGDVEKDLYVLFLFVTLHEMEGITHFFSHHPHHVARLLAFLAAVEAPNASALEALAAFFELKAGGSWQPAALDRCLYQMSRLFALPPLQFNCENETEWGLVEHQGIEYNVSRPYERGTLEEWDGSVPVGCTFGVTLIVSRDCPPSQDAEWSASVLASHVARGLADVLRLRVYHHRSQGPEGRSVVSSTVRLNPSRQLRPWLG
jgi:hypothetical protein